MLMLRVGCCGFPGGMRRYFTEFSLAEVQQTFYKPPRAETLRRWRELAGEEFEFTMKAWQLITHPPGPTYRRAGIQVENPGRYGYFRCTEEVLSAWEATREAAEILRASVVLLQCPPSFRQTEENLRNLREFLSTVSGELTLALELRAPWEEEVLRPLCQELGVIHCVDPLRQESVTRGIAYFRLHGRYEGSRIVYSHRYTEEELQKVLKKALAHGEAYVLFNNTHMREDARRLIQMSAP